MTASMGVANVLKQAGLLDNESTDFGAISTNSGATWFATQFFYSPEFFNRTLGTPQELYEFVVSWMEAYASIMPSESESFMCDIGEGLTSNKLAEFRSACPVLTVYGGDWAAFVTAMLNATSISYGDYSFVDRPVDVPNKVAALQDTVLLIQTSLSPYSRNRSTNAAYYIGPAEASASYTVPLSTQYMVTSYERLFVTAADGALATFNGSASTNFTFDRFEVFNLYPGTNGTLVTTTDSTLASTDGEFARPFNGMAPTTTQISAASSAAFGVLSGLVPSLLAQVLSYERHEVENLGLETTEQRSMLSLLRRSAQALYANSNFDGLAVCSQYPEPCGANDGIFVDGSFTDTPTLALSIGEYQSLEQGDTSMTLKVLLLNSNNFDNSTSSNPYLAYFNTDFNQDVAPGDFLWTKGQTPWRSPQIFQEYMDWAILASLVSPIEGTRFSTLKMSGTTIDNPAFGVVSGQAVEVFMILLQSEIPEVIIGVDRVPNYTAPLAALAQDLAESPVLLERVQEFFPPITEAPSPAPTLPPVIAMEEGVQSNAAAMGTSTLPTLLLTSLALVKIALFV